MNCLEKLLHLRDAFRENRELRDLAVTREQTITAHLVSISAVTFERDQLRREVDDLREQLVAAEAEAHTSAAAADYWQREAMEEARKRHPSNDEGES